MQTRCDVLRRNANALSWLDDQKDHMIKEEVQSWTLFSVLIDSVVSSVTTATLTRDLIVESSLFWGRRRYNAGRVAESPLVTKYQSGAPQLDAIFACEVLQNLNSRYV